MSPKLLSYQVLCFNIFASFKTFFLILEILFIVDISKEELLAKINKLEEENAGMLTHFSQDIVIIKTNQTPCYWK